MGENPTGDVVPPEHAAWRHDVRDALFTVLGGECNEAIRFHTLRCLGALAMPGCTDTLALALEDPDEDVRAVAAEALCNQRGAQVEALLLRTLREDPAPDCKLAAISGLRSLGELGHAPSLATSTLIELCTGRGQDVQWDDSSTDGWDDWLDVQVAAIRALSHLRITDSVPDIERVLNDEESQELADVACAAFTQLGDAGRAAIERCLTSGRERLRREAIAALLHAPRTEHIACLEGLLSDGAANVRASALEALVALGHADAYFERMLADDVPAVVTTALAHCTSAHTKAIAALTRHKSARVREAAARAMTRMARTRPSDSRNTLSDALPRLLSDPSPEVLSAAVEAAATLYGTGSLKLLTHILGDDSKPAPVRAAAATATASIPGQPAVDALAPILIDDDWHVRRVALAAVSARAAKKDQDALQALCVLLEAVASSSPNAELEAKKEVEQDTQVHPALASITEEADDGVDSPREQEHLSTLAAILAANEQVPTNTEMVLEDQDAARLAASSVKPHRKHVSLDPDIAPSLDAARFAARSLGQCPSEAACTALVQALEWQDEDVVNAALRSLQRIWTGSATPELADRIDTLANAGPIDQQICAARVLTLLQDPRGEARCREFLQTKDIATCQALLQSIAQVPLKADRTLEADVIALFEIELLRSPALKALAAFNPERVIDHLLPLLGGGDESVHQAIGTMLRSRELEAEPAARALLIGLEDPKWTKERVWILETLERLL